MAALVDGDLHKEMVSPAQAGSSEHERLLAPLVRMHRNTRDLYYVYTGIFRDGRIYWILDTAHHYRVPGNDLPADPIIVRQNWLRAYEFTTDRGATALNDYARCTDPFARVGKQQISVEVSSVIRASQDSFRVAWTERRYENGQLAGTERWTAILTIVIQPPRDAERLRRNPLGVFVTAINWSKELGQ